jgi:hypothetical protein
MNRYSERSSRIGEAGRKSEKKTAQRLGLRQTPASGAAIAKGDLRDESFLIEVKSTKNHSLSLRYDWLTKIAGEARMVGKDPALSVVFTTGQGSPLTDGRWIALPERLFRELQLIAAERK